MRTSQPDEPSLATLPTRSGQARHGSLPTARRRTEQGLIIAAFHDDFTKRPGRNETAQHGSWRIFDAQGLPLLEMLCIEQIKPADAIQSQPQRNGE
jgi:hypothetical protein